ncbi:MAG: hypothetical protein V3S16_06565 [Candidatus Desulfatibia sp.]
MKKMRRADREITSRAEIEEIIRRSLVGPAGAGGWKSPLHRSAVLWIQG